MSEILAIVSSVTPDLPAGTMSEAERQPTGAVFTQLQRGSVFVDSVGAFNSKLSTFFDT